MGKDQDLSQYMLLLLRLLARRQTTISKQQEAVGPCRPWNRQTDSCHAWDETARCNCRAAVWRDHEDQRRSSPGVAHVPVQPGMCIQTLAVNAISTSLPACRRTVLVMTGIRRCCSQSIAWACRT
jgi:hypothetical protein